MLGAVVALALAPASGVASAATFTAACSGTSGDVPSLVAAIDSANASAGPDTVALGSGCTYTLTTVNNNWYGPNGLPPIASDITVEGNGSTIARSGTAPKFRLFFVGADPLSAGTNAYVSPGPGVLTLRNVTLTGGLAKGGDSNGGGFGPGAFGGGAGGGSNSGGGGGGAGFRVTENGNSADMTGKPAPGGGH